MFFKHSVISLQLQGFYCAGRRAKVAKNIRKQMMTVRRKMSMQKRKLEAVDTKHEDSGNGMVHVQ